MPPTTAVQPVSGEVIEGLTPGELRHLRALEKRIEQGLTTFHEVGTALLEIRDKRLYRQTHPSFDAYVKQRFNLERVRAYQLMGAAEVADTLPAIEGAVGEAHMRPLVPIYNADPAAARKVWDKVVATARDESRPITVGLVREIVHATMPRDGVTDALADLPSATRIIVSSLRRATAALGSWPDKPARNEKKVLVGAVQELRSALDAIDA